MSDGIGRSFVTHLREAFVITTAKLRRVMQSGLARSSGVYGFSTLLNRAIPFLLLPVLTRYLSAEDVGKAALFMVAVNLTLPFVGVSTDSAVGRQYFDRERIDLPRYVTNCLYILVATAAIAQVLAFWLSGWLAAVFDMPAAWIWVVPLVAASRFVAGMMLTLWQVQDRTVSYAAYTLGLTAATFGLSIFFIVALRYGWQGRVLGDVLSIVPAGVVGVGLLWRGGWIRPGGLDRGDIAHALRYGGWVIPHVYGSTMMVSADRFFLTNTAGLGEMGLYAIAAQIASSVVVVAQAFNLAWNPWAYGRMKAGDPASLARVARVRRLSFAAIAGFAVALALVMPSVFAVFVGPEFGDAARFALWLTLGQAFMAMYILTVTPIFFAHKTHLLAAISMSVAVANLVYNYVLISMNGPVGAAQASALTTITLFVVTSRVAARVTRGLAADSGRGAPAAAPEL